MVADSISAVGVIVPAFNEAGLIVACLDSIRRAAGRVDLPVFVVVVDDRSDDCTAEVARDALTGMSARILRGEGRNVGAARAIGFEAAIANSALADPSRTWLATTDADSLVPPDWLAYQVWRANDGVDALAGLVDIAHQPQIHRLFAPIYALGIAGSTHSHVHGANMAMRTSVYEAAGGFQAAGCSEDVSLWSRVRALPGVNAVADPSLVVQTSARLVSRIEGGFATNIGNIAAAS